MNFSMSARFDDAHKVTLIQDSETGDVTVIWVDDTGLAQQDTITWGGGLPDNA